MDSMARGFHLEMFLILHGSYWTRKLVRFSLPYYFTIPLRSLLTQHEPYLTDIDFLVLQWPAHPTVFKFDFAAPVKYQYFGFDFGTLSASTTNLVVEVDLCYLI